MRWHRRFRSRIPRRYLGIYLLVMGSLSRAHVVGRIHFLP